MQWAVQIERTSLRPRNIKDILEHLGYSVVENDKYGMLFHSPRFDELDAADLVWETVKRLESVITGAAKIDAQFSLGGVIQFEHGSSRRYVFAEVHVAAGVGTVCAAGTVGPPAGLTPEEIEEWRVAREERQYRSMLETQLKRLKPAYSNPRAERVLSLLKETLI